MRIGILTYHTGYNYGASLQAFALQTTLEKLGLNPEIINFETERFAASREMFSRKPERRKEIIKIITRIPYHSSLIKRQKMFDDFTNQYLHVSPLYRTEQEVIDHAIDYDCIVCGSDQIWNLTQDDAPAANLLFYLNFPKKQRRIAYSASFGKWVTKADERADDFLPWVRQFDAISIREESGVEYLRSKGIDCCLTLDPTILLNREDYDIICQEPLVDHPYILMFGWNTNDDLIHVAKAVSKNMKLPILNIVPPPRAVFKEIKRKLDVGPREFLSMVKNAEFVVTNSFHGTAFSITYEKPFISVVSGNPDTRMENLMSQLGLSNRLVNPSQFEFSKIKESDFVGIQEKKNLLRKDSISYLKWALQLDA